MQDESVPRARRQVDEEYSQALARIGISLAGFLVCVASAYQATGAAAARPVFTAWVVATYFLGSVAWAVLIRGRRGPSVIRRAVVILGDLAITTFGTYMLGDLGAAFYPLFLWIIVGNGMRYGPPYLYAAMTTGMTGFALVIATGEAWRSQLGTGLSLLLGLLALPLFYARLIRRMHGLNGELLAERTELLRTREQLHELATRDSLTRLLNRGTILERLNEELERARRHRQPLAVVLGDLDHFKHVNDTFGHQAGDAVLAEVSSRLRAAVRPHDLAGRYGGEELIVVLPGITPQGAWQCAERLRTVIAEQPITLGNCDVQITCSFGVMAVEDAAAFTMEELIHHADGALYAAKRQGRNRVEAEDGSGVHARISPLPGSPASPQKRV